MSVIQKIQDKYGKVMAIIIALALVMFVVMLAFENGGSLFKGDMSTVGTINGKSVDINRYKANVDYQTQTMQQQGMSGGEAASQQANEAAWNTEIAQVLIHQESEKSGLMIGNKEMNDMLYGSNPPDQLRQMFTNPQTGLYDPTIVQQQFSEIKNKGTAQQKTEINAFLDQLIFQQLAKKYDALLTNSINYPKWLVEKENASNSLISKVSFVREPYTSISDSSIKISNEDILGYINKHKNDFKQSENRSISYISFNANPTGADSIKSKESLLALKPAFDSAHNMVDYLMTQGVNTYYDSYISSSRIQVPMKDSIFKVGTGNVYGPYIDGTNYSIAKVIGARAIPDTVKIRHILIGTVQMDPQSGQKIPIRDSASAQKLADSVALAIRNGANFDSMVVKFSNDQGSVNNGGVYDNVPSGQMVPAFNDFIFTNPVGAKAVVKTDFGYHYVEILSQKGSGMGYKIAYLTRPIEASQQTDMTANNDATHFASLATNQKSFDLEAEQLQKTKGIFKAAAQNIAPMASVIDGLGASRSFVKSIYNAKLGDVIQPERVGNNYVVALVTAVNKEGTMNAESARQFVEPLLINDKKAEIITKKIGKVTTLEAAAGLLKKPVEVADSLRFNGQSSPALGFEPKVIGAAFNKENVNKVISEPITGSQGVYIVKVDNIASTPVQAANVEEIRKMRYMQTKQQSQFQVLQALREAAKIEDNRSKYY
ncbi:MAG TPA: SurA N-terminal domain-containing protein [Niabella sp.]|nr:SurA N-terminal domain-containing protein [Niabella sp.]HQX21101.1 SurA N-terminal domain-containing protein [Niabella sp.]HRB51884.1 SurA N-terminal domain-containing protein [Niabella sp.]HRC05985.1 SurA N-terminal domain-containing protein [Niabella sp.]HRC22309.1 SurA N-terminal domain-containing protein [Niabella sp.]